jgi:mRNA-degrading endonuclease RelE of RelBE toxin-antitoxin system
MQIIYAPSVIKKLKKINSADKNKIRKKIESLKENPLSGKLLKGELTGLRSLKAWPLRIIYIFSSKTKTISIVAIDYRGSVYKLN